MKVSIVIPVYNEERTVEPLIRKVAKLTITDIPHEIIVVDDGSTDKTKSILKQLNNEINFRHIVHKKNKGKGRAVTSGLKKSTGDIIVIQDADLEYDPAYIPKLVKPVIRQKALVVYGVRLKGLPVLMGKNKTPFIHHFLGNKLLSLITSIIYGDKVSDMETGYKIMHRSVLRGMTIRSKSFEFEPEITAKILKKKIKIHEIDIVTKPRNYKEGKKLNTFRDGFKALIAIIKYRFTD